MNNRKEKMSVIYITASLLMVLISLDCISQDTSLTQKTLVIENTTLKSGLFKPRQKVFYLNSKVAIKRYSNDKIIRDRIDSINDSTISLKGITVNLTDIKRINMSRGRGLTILGTSVIAGSLGLFMLFGNTPPNYYGVQYINVPFLLIGVYGTAIGIIITTVGLTEIISTKYYHLDKDYKIIIK